MYRIRQVRVKRPLHFSSWSFLFSIEQSIYLEDRIAISFVTYLVTDDQARSTTQFFGRYERTTSTGRTTSWYQRSLPASCRCYVFDNFDLWCLRCLDLWQLWLQRRIEFSHVVRWRKRASKRFDKYRDKGGERERERFKKR